MVDSRRPLSAPLLPIFFPAFRSDGVICIFSFSLETETERERERGERERERERDHERVGDVIHERRSTDEDEEAGERPRQTHS